MDGHIIVFYVIGWVNAIMCCVFACMGFMAARKEGGSLAQVLLYFVIAGIAWPILIYDLLRGANHEWTA